MGDLRDLITDEQKRLMELYIETYAVGDESGRGYVREHRRASIEKILKPWADAKGLSMLGLMFKDSLIVSEDIQFKTPERTLEIEMRKDRDVTKFIDEFYAWIDTCETYCRGELGLGYEEWNKIANALYALQEYWTLINNHYDGAEARIPTPDGHQIIIANGCKPVKVMGKINAVFHISENFEAFRIAVSRHLNVATIRGKLCLSIHPMDYMTMSDNDCDWDSCMNWRHTGSYRQGTVEMMNSPYVVVAYLAASEPMKIFGHEWSNKKWRSLYIVHPEFIGSIKGYPYQIPEVDKIVINKLKDMAAAAGFQAQYGEVKGYDYNENEESFPSDHGNVELAFRCGYMYPDFGTINQHYGCVREDEKTNYIDIDYSGRPECMWCGGYYEEEPEDGLACSDCYSATTCYCCGCRISEDQLYYTGNGEQVCESCLTSYYAKSFWDNEYYRTDDMSVIYVVPDEFAEAIEKDQLLPEAFDYEVPRFYDHRTYDINDYDPRAIERFNSRWLKPDHTLKFAKKETWFGARYTYYVFLSDLLEDYQQDFTNDRYGYCEEIVGELFYDAWYSVRGAWANSEARRHGQELLEDK